MFSRGKNWPADATSTLLETCLRLRPKVRGTGISEAVKKQAWEEVSGNYQLQIFSLYEGSACH